MADKLAEALTDPEAAKELYVNYDDGGVLDERVAALVNLEELQLREVPPDVVLPEALTRLPKLRELGIGGKDDTLVMPALVGRLPVERMTVWDCTGDQMPAMPALRRLEFVTKDPKADVIALAARVPQLKQLRVWASHLEHGELPDDIATFTELEVLELIGCGLSTLPDALARLTRLHTLWVSNTPMKELPEVVTRLTGLRELQLSPKGMTQLPESIGKLVNLEKLSISSHINGLPPAMVNLRALRGLVLKGALNKGTLLSKWDDRSKLKPLPKVLSELTWLEELDLDHCGAHDLEPLRPLTRLRKLSLAWDGIQTIAPLAALTALEELSLEYADQVADLAPLAALKQLRVLNLDHCKPRSLDVLRELPALKVLHIEYLEAKRIDAIYDLDVELHAGDDVLAKYQQRAALRALPPIADVVARLGSPDVSIVEAAIGELATWVDASSTRDTNATPVALGMATAKAPAQAEEDEGEDDDDDDLDDDDDDDENLDDDDDDDDDDSVDEDGAAHTAPRSGALPQIDAALERHLGQLSPAVLARLFGALFRSAEDDYFAADRVASEIAARGDDAAQVALVDAVIRGLEHYDAGHRMHEDTVHDAMIDDVFPALRAPALAVLLAWCANDHLHEDGGDAMLGLFEPALTRAGDGERDALIARLEKYCTDVMKYDRGPDVIDAVWQMLDRIPEGANRAACDAMRDRVEAAIVGDRARATIEGQLESDDVETVTAGVLAALALPPDQVQEILGAMWRATRKAGLGPGARRGLFVLCKRADRADGMAEVIATAAADVPVAELRADADVLSLEAPALAKVVREAILDGRAALPAGVLDELRAWAAELDGMTRDEALSGEVQVMLYRAAQGYRGEEFGKAIDALAALDRYAPRDRAAEKPSELASMVAMQAESREWDHLRVLARHLHKLAISGKSLERVLAQLVAVCQLAKDDDGHRALEQLVPADVTWDILAFNLACRAAIDGDRSKTLQRVRRALELGKSPTQFMSDSDFAPYHGDVEFLAILKEFE
jgi:hypothetical protein